ncbi:hypothetical protein TWF481_005040 [Arthrobotrys musiformis]|uniref:Rhodopsin domain-containing protein n=1 Tax=Arthrobotrys musiformis TaxID=47236 RepID=A0AAV9WEF8_9PEZI
MTSMKWIRWGCLATAGITFANTIAGFFITVFNCRPVNYWDHFFVDACRTSKRTSAIIIGAIYILTDVATWALPMPLIFQLKLSTKQRILAFFTFGIGAVACVASGFRLDAVIKFTKYSSQSSSTLLIDAWTIIEMNIALLCACAPAVRALVMYYVPKLFPNFGQASTKSKGSQDTKGTDTTKSQPPAKVTATNGNEKS